MEIIMEIKRDVYLNRLIVRKHNGFIKVITGIRRSGKSYLLNTLFYNYLIAENIAEDHIIKFAFDSADDLLKIGEDPIVLDNEREDRKVDPSKFLNWLQPQIADKKMHYILLDEVQKLGAFESVMNGFLRKSNLDVYVTGSNSKFLSKDILTEFEGRGDEVHVLPLSFSEYYAFKGGDKSEAFDDCVHGGNRICDATVDRYISHMEDAFMLTRVKRYNVKGRKYIGTPYKIYFEDIGLRNARLNFRQIEGTHIMENIIYNELRYRGYQVDVGMVESRERDADGKETRTQLEIDFIATLGSKKYYIQSAYAIPDQAKYEQETASFDKTMDSFKKIVVVEKSMKPRRDEKGYVMIGVKEFLLDKDSLEA